MCLKSQLYVIVGLIYNIMDKLASCRGRNAATQAIIAGPQASLFLQSVFQKLEHFHYYCRVPNLSRNQA
jgi:hypothetical protein